MNDFLKDVKLRLYSGERPDFVTSPFGTHGVAYDEDDEGEFATIGFTLPPGFYAEIEDGTYGELQGFRIYLEPRCSIGNRKSRITGGSMNERERVVLAHRGRVVVRRKRVGQPPNISYAKRYVCPLGHYHHDMLAACLCVERDRPDA